MWSEDETIGWVYQFFNTGEERRKMREESRAPRNSRELAIRNQFFTPQYVVQFLCDNTLGRIWYEMRKGDTRLADFCEYMVRPPEENVGAKKDPRDIRIIDPACGSGHFLLYCFILLLLIYEEAWADETAPESGATGRTLRHDYPSLEELRKAAPELILLHNLHGVDIDPRCAQIAQLALWMRAQRAFKEAGFRVPIGRSFGGRTSSLPSPCPAISSSSRSLRQRSGPRSSAIYSRRSFRKCASREKWALCFRLSGNWPFLLSGLAWPSRNSRSMARDFFRDWRP